MPLKFYLLACLVLELIELRLLQSPRQIIVIACYKGKESQEIGHEAKEGGVMITKMRLCCLCMPKVPLSVPDSSSFNS